MGGAEISNFSKPEAGCERQEADRTRHLSAVSIHGGTRERADEEGLPFDRG